MKKLLFIIFAITFYGVTHIHGMESSHNEKNSALKDYKEKKIKHFTEKLPKSAFPEQAIRLLPLYIAIFEGNAEKVNNILQINYFLDENKVNLEYRIKPYSVFKTDFCHIMDFYNDERMHYDDRHKRTDIIHLKKAKTTPLLEAIAILEFEMSEDRLKIVELLLLKQDFDVVIGLHKMTYLHFALMKRLTAVVDLIIKHHDNLITTSNYPCLEIADDCNQTPLHYAVAALDVSAVSSLLKIYKNKMPTDNAKGTPLHHVYTTPEINRACIVGYHDESEQKRINLIKADIIALFKEYGFTLSTDEIESWNKKIYNRSRYTQQ